MRPLTQVRDGCRMSVQHIPPPRVLKLKPENIPLAIRRSGQCVTWRMVLKRPKDPTKPSKWSKVPMQPDGSYASTMHPDSWWSFAECLKAYQAGLADGVGYVASIHDRTVLGDLDHCFDPTIGTIDPWAAPIIDAARREHAYIELSPSGTGFHIFGKGPQGFEGRKANGAEMYCDGRFFTLTGWVPFGLSKTLGKLDATLKLISARIGASGKQGPRPKNAAPVIIARRPYPDHFTDKQILKIAFKSKSGDKLKRLLNGDISDYGGDASRADMACASILGFWFWLDADAIARVMDSSSLAREKWDSMRGKIPYLEYTIRAALADKNEYYGKPCRLPSMAERAGVRA